METINKESQSFGKSEKQVNGNLLNTVQSLDIEIDHSSSSILKYKEENKKNFFTYKTVKKKYPTISELKKLDKETLKIIIETVQLEMSIHSNSFNSLLSILNLGFVIFTIMVTVTKGVNVQNLIMNVLMVYVICLFSYYLVMSQKYKKMMNYLNAVRYVISLK